MAFKFFSVHFFIFSAVLFTLITAKPMPDLKSSSERKVAVVSQYSNEVQKSGLTAARNGRQYFGHGGYPGFGFGGGNSFSSASASAGSFGGGFPFGNSGSFSNAHASSNNFGFGKK